MVRGSLSVQLITIINPEPVRAVRAFLDFKYRKTSDDDSVDYERIMTMKKIGVVGCGNISGIYLRNICYMFDNIEIAGVCDLVPERAKAASDTYNLRIYKDMYEMFADPEVDIILNITRPYQHYNVTKEALLAGKHVYSEKPLAVNIDDGRELVELAKSKNLYLGGAPDTYMGTGIQTARRLLDEGAIGKIVGANIFFLGRGPENWHPDPQFFYDVGGGPVLDMGPYYTTMIINLFGHADSVMAYGRISFPERVIGSEPYRGEIMHVKCDTFTTGAVRFDSGAVASMTFSFDSYAERSEFIEIYGETGSILVPDPNCYSGPLKLLKPGKGYEEVPLDKGFSINSRGLGLSEMADSIENGRLHNANCNQQLHALDIMTAFERSSRSNAPVKMTTPFERQPRVNPDNIKGNYNFKEN